MNVEKVSGKKILGDTVKMTVLSLAMQTAAMFFNVYLSGKAGTAAVGFMSLIFSLFSFIMVLANGNILTSTSRFVSEARGAGRCGFGRLMRYALTFSFCLSMFFSLSSFVLAGRICRIFLKNESLAPAVRFIALSLPFASAGSCIKGYFHGIRRVNIPMQGDLVEFASKWTLLLGGLLIWGHFSGGIDGSSTFYVMTAAAVFAGEAVSFFYYLSRFIPEARAFASLPPCGMSLVTDTPKGYLKSTFPILVSGYVQMLLSTANELIVPAALLRYSRSTEAALASYGMFEAMIMPAVFFPSAVLTSLSGVIVPEAALANQLPDRNVRRKRLRTLTDDTFTKVCSFAFFVSGLFLFCGNTLGKLLCPSDDTVSRSLVILAPVIPFIYLEIVLEGMLKGMGRQNFSTAVSLGEYAVRIACVIIFVGKIGFSGVLISYYASNVLSNIARIAAVCREAQTGFSLPRYIIKPLAEAFICCEAGRLMTTAVHAAYSGALAEILVFVLTALLARYAVAEAEKAFLKDTYNLKSENTENYGNASRDSGC